MVNSAIRVWLGKISIHGIVEEPKALLTKYRTKALLIFTRTPLDDPKGIWKNSLNGGTLSDSGTVLGSHTVSTVGTLQLLATNNAEDLYPEQES